MKVEWVSAVEIEVIESFDEALDDAESTTEVFHPGTISEFDIFGYAERFHDGHFVEDKTIVNIQFPNGSVAFGISTSWFKELDK